MEWIYFRVDGGKRFEEEYVRTDPDRRFAEYFGPNGGVWIRGHPRGLEILRNDLGEQVPFWEYYKDWAGYVRLNYDLMIAEYFSDSEGAWIRRDAIAPPIVFKGNGTPITEAEALSAIESLET